MSGRDHFPTILAFAETSLANALEMTNGGDLRSLSHRLLRQTAPRFRDLARTSDEELRLRASWRPNLRSRKPTSICRKMQMVPCAEIRRARYRASLQRFGAPRGFCASDPKSHDPQRGAVAVAR
jgi:hypothetical protein